MNINAEEARKLTDEAKGSHPERLYNIISQGIRNRALKGESCFHYSTFSKNECNLIRSHFTQLNYVVDCVYNRMKYTIYFYW